MAGEKTEKPTQKKIKDAAKKGQILKVKDLLTTILIVLGLVIIFNLFSLNSLATIIRTVIFNNFTTDYSSYAMQCFSAGLMIILPILILCMSCTIVTGLFQSGMKLATEALKFDFTAVSPIKGLKKIFNLRTLKEFFKSFAYLCLFVFSAYFFWGKYSPLIISLIYRSPNEIPFLWIFLITGVLAIILSGIAIIILLDCIGEFFIWLKGLKMDKKEVEREYKEMNGNPEVKGKRRQLHEELLSGEMQADIKKSKAVIVNPTHIAICLYVNKAVTFVPFISVMEKNAKALAVRKYAEKHRIPVIEDIALARSIYHSHKKNTFISTSQLEPVMDILLWLEGIDMKWEALVAQNDKRNTEKN